MSGDITMSGEIFFSWQDARPTSVGRSFIRSMITEVIELDSSGRCICEAARDGLDYARIERASACVVDLTSIPIENGLIAPNPDGLIDLGHAIPTIGWQRVVCLVNTDFGLGVLNGNHRVLGHLILFSLGPDSGLAERLVVRHRVCSSIANALRPSLTSYPRETLSPR